MHSVKTMSHGVGTLSTIIENLVLRIHFFPTIFDTHPVWQVGREVLAADEPPRAGLAAQRVDAE